MGLDIYFFKKKEIGYFRKVNFLVKYFANNHHMDVDDQIPVYVEKDAVIDLLDRCNKVLENHELAEELLPTMSGFFFGNTKYDEYYFENVERVRDYIKDKLLPMFDSLEENEFIEFDIWY